MVTPAVPDVHNKCLWMNGMNSKTRREACDPHREMALKGHMVCSRSVCSVSPQSSPFKFTLASRHSPLPPPDHPCSSPARMHHLRSTFPGHRGMRFQNWRARGMSKVNLIYSWGKPGPIVFREIWWLPRSHSASYLWSSSDLPESFSPLEFTLAHPQKWIWDPQKSPVRKWKNKSTEWKKIYVI